MRHLSRLALVGFVPLSLFSLTSCNKTYYTSAKQLAPFLHEITYNDYADDPEHRTTDINGEVKFNFGCSSIRNGKIYGRNYDYYYTDSPSFLVKVKRNANRFQSIGIANSLALTDANVIEMEKKPINQNGLSVIPNFTLDGINENGVIANMNVVDYDDGGIKHLTTNPGAPQLYLYSTVRYILDHATSAQNAVDLLREHDLYTLDRHKNNIHLMIADPKETHIVEFIQKDGEQNVTIRDSIKSEEGGDYDKPIMTNFYNDLTQDEVNSTYPQEYEGPKYVNNNAHGVERYLFIQKHYAECKTVQGMWSVLHDMRYGGMYLNPNYPDFASEDFSQKEVHEWNPDYYTDPEKLDGELIGEYRNIYNATRYVLDGGLRDIGRAWDVWITMHSSIYNIEKKTLRLNVQEDYTHTYNYDLNF